MGLKKTSGRLFCLSPTRSGSTELSSGTEKSCDETAADLVEHYETRRSVLEGKAMIVAMIRDI